MFSFTFQRLSDSFVKTIKVFFTFQGLSESFVKTIKVFFTFQGLSESFVKTIKVFFTFQDYQCLHLHFKRLQCLQSFTLSKDNNVFIYISKDFDVFSHLCFQKTTMSSFTFQKTSMSSVIYAFKRRQCLHLHFKRLRCLQSFTLSKDDNVFFYISKYFNDFSHLCFQKTAISSFTFQRLQHLLSFIGLNVLVYASEDSTSFVSMLWKRKKKKNFRCLPLYETSMSSCFLGFTSLVRQLLGRIARSLEQN